MAKAASKINRRAAVTMLATILVVVAVLLTILVVDAAYLVAVNRGMQDVSSIMALAGAPELLDPNLLLDAAGPPTPDQAAARTAAASLADAYRQRNNAILPSLQRVDAGDVVMQTGFVDDVTANPPLLDLAATEHNTLFVYSVPRHQRRASGELSGRFGGHDPDDRDSWRGLRDARQPPGRLPARVRDGSPAHAVGDPLHVVEQRANTR